MSNFLQLSNVSYRYPGADRSALSDVSVQFDQGERVAIMGGNGGGKSTLAKVLGGLIEPGGGCLELVGYDSHPLPVAMLFQNPDNQMVAVTVDKETVFALENLATSPDRMAHQLATTLRRFDIEHLQRRLTSELSGGEKQRVALAAVMISSPPILVLDEPDSFLDIGGREALQDHLSRLRQANPELIEIRITQYPDVARRYPRMIIMHDSRLVADGSPADIFAARQQAQEWGIVPSARCVVEAALEITTPHRRQLGSLVLKHASFGFEAGKEILSNLSLEINAGDLLAVVGPSGSGKTTLGNLLSGLLEPSSGSLEVIDATGQPIPKEELCGLISAVFQQPERQFFLPTCGEEIRLGPANFGSEMTNEQVADTLALVGLPAHYIARDPFSLSGGEKRRLAFAVVLAMRPQLIVFDEPTCGLDQEGVGRFLALAEQLKRQRCAIVLITHDGELVRHLADKVLCLKESRQYELVSLEDFAARPELHTMVSAKLS